jgi:hypothetical protein
LDFGQPGKRAVRFSYASSEETIATMHTVWMKTRWLLGI